MALSAFDDRAAPPTEADLAAVLGRSGVSWRALRDRVAERFDPLVEEWTFAGAKWGWSCRLKHRKRAILYLTPGRRRFFVGMALGEKAVRASHEIDLPASLRDAIEAAPRYAEGRGLRREVRVKKDLDGILELATVKMTT